MRFTVETGSLKTPRRVSHFVSVDEWGEPDGRFGCAATNAVEAARWAARAKHGDIALCDTGPVPLEHSPSYSLDAIRQSPLLGPDWLPLAHVLARAAELSRNGRFWRMDTYAPQANYDPGPSPFVQGLTEFDGTHVIEVGGLGHGDGWTSAETRGAFDLLGWTEADDPVSRNLTLTLSTSWTGEGIARLVLDVFVAVYGHDIAYPIAFEGPFELWAVAALKLEVMKGGEIFVNPAARERWAHVLLTGESAGGGKNATTRAE